MKDKRWISVAANTHLGKVLLSQANRGWELSRRRVWDPNRLELIVSQDDLQYQGQKIKACHAAGNHVRKPIGSGGQREATLTDVQQEMRQDSGSDIIVSTKM